MKGNIFHSINFEINKTVSRLCFYTISYNKNNNKDIARKFLLRRKWKYSHVIDYMRFEMTKGK